MSSHDAAVRRAENEAELLEQLIQRASQGCEGPLDEPCFRSLSRIDIWCDPCRQQEAAKLITRLLAESDALSRELEAAQRERDEAREQFDKHVAWASDQAEHAEADRDQLTRAVAGLQRYSVVVCNCPNCDGAPTSDPDDDGAYVKWSAIEMLLAALASRTPASPARETGET